MRERKYFLLILVIFPSLFCCFQETVSHNHSLKEKHNSNISHKKRQNDDEQPKFYSQTELLKEQYQLKKKYSEICANFSLSDRKQWPISEIQTSQLAQKLFAFDVKDPRDFYDIAVNKKEIDPTYWAQAIAKIQPWAILIVVCLIGQCMCCCQIFCVPELKIFRRCCQVDFNKETESRCEKNMYFAFILLVGGLIFFCAGMVFMNSDMQISLVQLHCTTLWTQQVVLGVAQPAINGQVSSENDKYMEIFQGGNTGDKDPVRDPMEDPSNQDGRNSTWNTTYGGVDVIKQQYKLMSDFFKQIKDLQSYNQIQQVEINPFYKEFNAVQEKIPQLYEAHRNKTLRDPNYIKEVKLQNEFIESLGPVGTIGTIGWSLLKEVANRKHKISFIEGTKNHTVHLGSISDQIASEADQAIKNVDQLTYTANENLKSLDNVIDFYGPNVGAAGQIMEGYFKVVMFVVFCGLLGFICVAWPKVNGCAVLLHLSWYCSTCVLIIGLLFSSVLFASGVVMNTSVCAAADSIINDQDFLANENITLDEKLTSALNYCMFSKHDDIFGGQKYMREIQILERNIDSFKKLELSKQSLNSKLNYAQNVLNLESLAAPQESQTATNSLVQWTDYSSTQSLQSSAGQCQVTRDQWIWTDHDCTYQTIVDSDSPDFDLGFTVCLRIARTKESFVQNRYNEKEFQTCKENIGNQAVPIFHSIQMFRQSVQDVFSEVLQDLKNYNSDVDKLDIDIDKVSGKVLDVEKEFSKMINAVSQENGGLQSTLDCSFVSDSLMRAKNAVCVSALNGLLLQTLFFLATSVLLILFSLLVCSATARILPNQDNLIQQQLLMHNSSILYNSQLKHTHNPQNMDDSDYIQTYSRKQLLELQQIPSNNILQPNNNNILNNTNLSKNNFNSPNNLNTNGNFKSQNNPNSKGRKSTASNHNIFSDNENPMQFKELDNSFIKQTQEQLKDLTNINYNHDEMESSFHSANNHF